MHGVLENGYLGHWDRWTDKLSVWGTKESKVKIQNYAVNRLISYNDDNFLTNEGFYFILLLSDRTINWLMTQFCFKLNIRH